jgi:hypothetical protein
MSKVTRCIFCGGRPLTREDYNPRWLLKRGLIEPGFSHTLHYADQRELNPVTGKSRAIATGSYTKARGDPLTQTLKVVCRTCNNGWMSRLQSEVIPIMTPLITDYWPAIMIAEAVKLATWAATYTMVIEFAHILTVAVPRDEREYLRLHQAPPSNWIVCFGLYGGPKSNSAFWHRSAAYSREGIFHKDTKPNVQTTTFTVGGILFHVLSCPAEIAPLPDQYAEELGLTLLWPFFAGPAVRPNYSFTTQGVLRICRLFWLSIGDEFPDPPHGF